MAGRPIRIAIVANGRGARTELDRTGRSVVSLSNSLSSMAKLGAGLFAIDKLKQAGAAIVAIGNEYSAQLSQIGALASENDQKLMGGMTGVAKKLEANAKEYAKYGSTVGDASAGVTELVKAGRTLPQALDDINATLVLSKAGALDVATASGLVATALGTWGEAAGSAADVSNILANAANISTADVTDLGEALKYVAPVAADASISIKDTASYLAMLSNAGINGSAAGTGLRKVMASLQAPTGKAAKIIDDLGVKVFQANGKARPFEKVLAELNTSMRKLTDEERKGALKKIFGLEGMTSSQVILDNIKGLDEYREGVGRAGAAAKLAEANTSGFVGTLSKLKAEGKSAVQGFYREYEPKMNQVLVKTVDLVKNAGESFKDNFGPALVSTFKATSDALKSANEIVQAMPDGFGMLALQVGVAAFAFPKLAAGVAAGTGAIRNQITYLRVLRLEMMDAERRSVLAGSAFGRMGGAARSAAGVGGMVALMSASQQASGEMKTLTAMAGGAAMGFSMGGPWGAAIGGAAGAVWGLVDAFKNTGEKARIAALEAGKKEAWADAKKSADDLTDALYGTAGGYSKVAAEAVKQNFRDSEGNLKPWVKQLNDAGVTLDTLTRATLGQDGAQKVLDKSLKTQATNLKSRGQALKDAKRTLEEATQQRAQAWLPESPIDPQQAEEAVSRAKAALSEVQAEYDKYKANVDAGSEAMRLSGAASDAQKARFLALRTELGLTAQGYRTFPKELRTQFESDGLPQTLASIKTLRTEYNLTPKQVATIVSATGIGKSKADLKDLGITAKQVNDADVKIKAKVEKGTVAKDGRAAGTDASIAMEKGIVSRKRQISAASRNMASQGAKGAGSEEVKGKFHTAGADNTQGFINGIGSKDSAVTAEASRIANLALSAVQTAQDSHSPSRKTKQLGRFFTQGFGVGIKADAAKVAEQADKMVNLASGKAKKRMKTVLAEYKKGKNGLNALAKKQAALKDGDFTKYLSKNSKLYKDMGKAGVKNLTEARQALKDAKQAWKDYFDTVKTGVVAFGDITQLGKNSAGNATAAGIVYDLKTRTAAVQQYVTTIKDLEKAGLNSTAIQQILDAGVDGGLQTALAIKQGGKGTIAEINRLQSQIDKSGNTLGTFAAEKYKRAGINMAEGIVKGLESKEAGLEKVVVKMANQLTKELKKAWKIKSPSRVFKAIGGHVIGGLKMGLDDKPIMRQGDRLAHALTDSFGTPALDAYLQSPAVSGSAQSNVVHLTLSGTAVDDLRAGRQVQAQIDLAQAVGFRRTA